MFQAIQSGIQAGVQHEADIPLMIEDPRDDRARIAHFHHQADLRVTPRKDTQNRNHVVRADCVDHKATGVSILSGEQQRLRILFRAEDPSRVIEQQAPEVREFQASPTTLEEFNAVHLLKSCDVRGQGGLLQAERVRSSGHAACTGDRVKGFQCGQKAEA